MSTNEPQMHDLMSRVERLEPDNRRLKTAMALLCSPVTRFAPLSEAIDLGSVYGVKMRPEGWETYGAWAQPSRW